MELLLAGQTAIGFIAGLFIGLSRSAVVSAVVPAVLAFSSDSALSLSVAETTTAADQHLVGLQLVLIAVGIVVGLGTGMLVARAVGDLPLRPPAAGGGHWLLRRLW
jgi:hypothetical protein